MSSQTAVPGTDTGSGTPPQYLFEKALKTPAAPRNCRPNNLRPPRAVLFRAVKKEDQVNIERNERGTRRYF